MAVSCKAVLPQVALGRFSQVLLVVALLLAVGMASVLPVRAAGATGAVRVTGTSPVTASAAFYIDGRDSAGSALLVALTSQAKPVHLALGVVAVRTEGAYGGTDLFLYGTPGYLPGALVVSHSATGAWGSYEAAKLVSSANLVPGATYTAQLALNRDMREVSVRVAGGGQRRPVFSGHVPLEAAPLGELGVGGAAGETAAAAIGKVWGVKATASYERAGTPASLANGFALAFAAADTLVESPADPEATAPVLTASPGDDIRVSGPDLPMALPGKVTLTWQPVSPSTWQPAKSNAAPSIVEAGPALGVAAAGGSCRVPDLAPGAYLLGASYAENGFKTALGSARVRVASGQVEATVSLADNRPWATSGTMRGTVTLRTRRILQPLTVVLQARAFGASDKAWHPVWQTQAAPGDTAAGEGFSFTYSATQSESVEELRAVVSGQAGLLAGTRSTPVEREFFVSPSGSDQWSGRREEPNDTHTDGPFATLDRARDALRELKEMGSLPEGGATVWLTAGIHTLTTPLQLTDDDSGTATAPITFAAMPGATVIVQGGTALKNLKPYKGAIEVADLTAQGIGPFDWYPELNRGNSINPPMEVFSDGKRGTMARWPNLDPSDSHGGTWDYVASADSGSTTAFHYAGDRPSSWKNTVGALVCIWPDWNWSDQVLPLGSIDASKKLISLASGAETPIMPGRRFCVMNLLEELDSPGEWYYDTEANKLYVWPEKAGADVVISTADSAALLSGASYVTIKGLRFESFHGTAITMDACADTRIADCSISNVGSFGVAINDGLRCGVSDCNIHDTGRGGVILNGGDRQALTPGSNYVDNTEIHHYGRLVKCYQAGIVISGVGNRISHNDIHDGPHNAILLSGNEHIIEYNEVHHVCMEGADSGAFYMGRDWSQQGNVLRYNYFHDIAGFGLEDETNRRAPWHYESPHAAWAVYLDDCSSGTTIEGNLFVRVPLGAVMIGGGRDNKVVGNVIVDSSPAVHLDARWDGYDYTGGSQAQALDAIDYQNPPYSERYPNLPHVYDINPRLPMGNRIEGNVIAYADDNWRGSWNMSKGKGSAVLWEFDNYDAPRFVVDHNLIWHAGNPIRVDAGAFGASRSTMGLDVWQKRGFDTSSITEDPLFVDPAADNYSLRADSPAFGLGFAALPIGEMGLYATSERTWPVVADTRRDGTTYVGFQVTPGKVK